MVRQNISRRSFMKMAAAVPVFSVIAGCQESLVGQSGDKKNKPNIVLIYIDDMDFAEIGCYGGKVLTPNMDEIANDGCKFTRGYVTTAVCAPSRYGVLTGRYPSRNKSYFDKFTNNGQTISVDNVPKPELYGAERTIAHIMKDAGYVTGLCGKWHSSHPKGLEKVAGDADPRDADVLAKLKRNYEKMQQRVKHAGGFDCVESLYWENKEQMHNVPEELRVHNMNWITKSTLDFIETNKDRPFFLKMATTLPHQGVFQKWAWGPGEGIGSWKNWVTGDIRKTPLGYIDDMPRVQPSGEDVIERVKKAGVFGASAIMTWEDDGIGVVMKKLDELGLAENTVVILISDHQSRGKWTIYERGVNTPFIVCWKGTVKPGQVCEQIIANIDVAPTVCDICGIKDKAADFDGVSFKGQLLDSKRKGREWLALEMGYARGVVTKKYKYIALRYPKNIQDKITDENRKSYNWQGKPWIDYKSDFPKDAIGHLPVYVKFPGYYDYDQLYDLEKDPMETANLAADDAYKSVLEKMKRKLREHIKSTAQRFGEI